MASSTTRIPAIGVSGRAVGLWDFVGGEKYVLNWSKSEMQRARSLLEGAETRARMMIGRRMYRR